MNVFIYPLYLPEDIIKINFKYKERTPIKQGILGKVCNFLDPLFNELKYIKISYDKRYKNLFFILIGRDILKIFKFLM